MRSAKDDIQKHLQGALQRHPSFGGIFLKKNFWLSIYLLEIIINIFVGVGESSFIIVKDVHHCGSIVFGMFYRNILVCSNISLKK